MTEGLLRIDSLFGVIGEQLVEKIDQLLGGVGEQAAQMDSLVALKLPVFGFHVRGIDFEAVEDCLGGSAQDFVDLVDLIEFVFAIEEGVAGNHFEEDAAVAPDVHLVVVEAVGEQALGGTVPARRNVLGEGLLVEDALAGAEVRQLYRVARDEHILGLDVAVEDALLVDVGDGLEQAEHVVLDLHGAEGLVVHEGLVHVLLHELEDEGELAGGLVVEDFDELDDVVVGGEVLECLDFGELLDFVDAVVFFLHALDGDHLAGGDRVGLENLRERPVALLLVELVLVHQINVITIILLLFSSPPYPSPLITFDNGSPPPKQPRRPRQPDPHPRPAPPLPQPPQGPLQSPHCQVLQFRLLPTVPLEPGEVQEGQQISVENV